MKANSNHSDTRQILRNFAISGIYRLQEILGIRPRGICLLSGCPRSGTSAVRNWLQSQKQIASIFEDRILISAHRFLNEVERFRTLHTNRHILIGMIRRLVYGYCAETKYIWRKQLVIKEPLEPIALPDRGYSEFLGNIKAIFPEINFIFMVRDPIETVWSMTQRKWGYSLTKPALRNYSVEESVLIWKDCARVIKEYAGQPNVYVCCFERLIKDPKSESHRIFDFLGIKGKKIFQPQPTSKIAFS